MKNKSLTIILPFIFILLLIGGCSKQIVDPPGPETTSGDSGGNNINYPPAAYSEEGLPKEGTLDDAIVSPMTEPTAHQDTGRTSPGLQPIYFHFDQATIPTDMMDFLIQNANYLKENPSLYVVIEGNCDERGAKEYNMALGERRALNTRNFLADMGIHGNRIRTVSYGEERPSETGSDESTWAKNRRVDFVTE